MVNISAIKGREVLDSRGEPTVEATVWLSNGHCGRAAVPTGTSVGEHEASVVVDKDLQRYHGQGKKIAITHIEDYLFPRLQHVDPFDQLELDATLCKIDGSINKSNLGANALLAISLAVAKASASSFGKPLYAYIAKLHGKNTKEYILPVPTMNLLNGGLHANNLLDIQEFSIIPCGAPSFKECLRWGAEIFQTLKETIHDKGLSCAVGDEGGFAPALSKSQEALDLLLEAISHTPYRLGTDLILAIDCAASQWVRRAENPDEPDVYGLKGENLLCTTDQMLDYLKNLTRYYPIRSIEDGLGEEDWEGFVKLNQLLGEHVQIIGDDLFTTNPALLSHGILMKAANAVLIKPNQIGTLSETITAIRMAQLANFNVIISHRSGETEDTSLVDLAVGTQAMQIKTGSLSRGERIAKYNRLLRIEEELGTRARFAGMDPFKHFNHRTWQEYSER